MRKKDITGLKFNRLLVIRELQHKKGQKSIWECMCDCGTKINIFGANMRNGHTQSCGCLQKEMASITKSTHRQSIRHNSTPEYRAWSNLKERCYNPNNNRFHVYGALGICVCERWLKFENFFEDMGKRPSKDHSIDRINNNGNYEPSNCKWSTDEEQSKNKRNSRRITYNGKTMILADWARELSIHPSYIAYHLKCGRSFEGIYNYFKNGVPFNGRRRVPA